MTARLKLEKMIAQGESQTLEFKKSLSLKREALEALCAMVNADNARGVIIFGIKSDGSVCGIEPGNLDKAQRSLSQTIKEKFDPPLIAQIKLGDLKGKQILVLSAKRSLGIPYHEYNGRAWIRQGTENRKLSFAEKQQLMKGSSIIPASVDFSFHKILLEPEAHKYSLVVAILLKVPPIQKQWRLDILWPILVKIVNLKGLKREEDKLIKRFKYAEFIRGDMRRPIFPGETITVIGLKKDAELEYIYDDTIWDSMTDNPRDLYYKLYLETHPPVEGFVPFNRLNVF